MEENKEALNKTEEPLESDETEEPSCSKELWKALCNILNPKRQKVLGRVVWSLVLVALAGLVAQGLYTLWDDELNPQSAYYDRDYVSDDVVMQQPYHGKPFIYNRSTGARTLRGIDEFYLPDSDFDTLALYFLGPKRGYFNRYTGQPVLEPLYDRAWVFSEGVALAAQGDSLYLIDPTGRKLWSREYNDQARRERCLDYAYHNGACVMNDTEGRMGLIDLQGQWLLPANYKSIRRISSGDTTLYVVTREDGEGELCGIVDSRGRVLLPCEFRTVSYHDGHLFASDAQHLQWRYDLEGRRYDEPLCYNVCHLRYESDIQATDDAYDYQITLESFAPLFSYTSSSEGFKGLMDARGHRLTPPVYRSIKALSPTLYCCAYDEDYDHAVLLNEKGQVVR